MKFFVTGVAGFLGSHVADELISQGHEGMDVMFISGSMDNVHERCDYQVDAIYLNQMKKMIKT